jgi:hypothetical protein
MSQYANKTSVSVDKSKSELEWILRKYGAKQFAYATDDTKALIGFVMNGRQIRFTLPLPDPAEFERSDAGRVRTKEKMMECWEQACRARWRALVLVVKAKLEAIASGIVSMDDEFLAYTALPTGQTIGQAFSHQIQTMINTGRVPMLLPEGE